LLNIERERAVASVVGVQPELEEGRKELVKQAHKITTVVAVALAFASIWVVMIAGTTAEWLTEKLRVFGLLVLPPAIAAGLVVVYFDWRAKLLNGWLTSVKIAERRR
jgi:hypothetical protein